VHARAAGTHRSSERRARRRFAGGSRRRQRLRYRRHSPACCLRRCRCFRALRFLRRCRLPPSRGNLVRLALRLRHPRPLADRKQQRVQPLYVGALPSCTQRPTTPRAVRHCEPVIGALASTRVTGAVSPRSRTLKPPIVVASKSGRRGTASLHKTVRRSSSSARRARTRRSYRRRRGSRVNSSGDERGRALPPQRCFVKTHTPRRVLFAHASWCRATRRVAGQRAALVTITVAS
jgi:hypothetical protein